jgi:hypothetical protein
MTDLGLNKGRDWILIFTENQADLENIGAFTKIRRI